MSDKQGKILGIVAQFNGVSELLAAAEKIRLKGFTRWDCHSPFVIHGMDKAMGEKRSHLGWIVGACALLGGGGILALQGWTSVSAYPHIISGKALFSYQAFFPITFAVTILSAAAATLFGFLAMIGLHFNHPLFESELFTKFSDDGFLVSIEAGDPLFDPVKTEEFLRSIGCGASELLESHE